MGNLKSTGIYFNLRGMIYMGKFSPSGGSGKEEKEKEKMKEKRKKRKKKEDFLKEVVASNVSYFECLFDDRWRVLKGIG